MRRVERAGTVFYESESLRPFPSLQAVVTTRHGGISLPPFDSLNLSHSVGDDPTAVQENTRRLHQALGLDPRATVDARQAQAAQVALVGLDQKGTRINQVDALITDIPGVPLMLRFADCVPILFFDPVHRVIAVAHAGWRGTVLKVVANTIRAMQATYRTKPSELHACVGPSIGPCCYEIGPDVRSRIEEAFPNANDLLIRQNGSVHLDLWQANASIMRELGVGDIEIARICTADHTHDLYSWRREYAKTGRFAVVIALQE